MTRLEDPRRAAASGLALLSRWLTRSRRAAFEQHLAGLVVTGDAGRLRDALSGASCDPAGLLADGGRLSEAVWEAAEMQLRLLGAPRPRRPTLLALAVLAGHPVCVRMLTEYGYQLDWNDPATEPLVAAAANRSWTP